MFFELKWGPPSNLVALGCNRIAWVCTILYSGGEPSPGGQVPSGWPLGGGPCNCSRARQASSRLSAQSEHEDLARSLDGDGEAYARIVTRHQDTTARRMRLFARQ